jgi:hypothetical protein
VCQTIIENKQVGQVRYWNQLTIVLFYLRDNLRDKKQRGQKWDGQAGVIIQFHGMSILYEYILSIQEHHLYKTCTELPSKVKRTLGTLTCVWLWLI